MRIHRHRNRKRQFDIPDFKVNEQIKAPEVRLIHEDGSNEVIKTVEAIKKANDDGFDLIEVSPKAEPPVCKIMDFGSFKYQKVKEAKKKRAASKEVEIKGIRLTLRIGTGDLEVRRKQAVKFLEKGNKVRIELILRGREKAYRDRAVDVINNFIESLKEDYEIRVESPAAPKGNRLQSVIARES